MRIVKDPSRIKFSGPIVALGNFDGVHLGHKKILEAAAKFAKKSRGTSIALTFDPHPQQVVSPERGLRLLTTLEEREDLISRLGIDELLVIRFDDALRKLSWDQFAKKYLVDRLRARMVFVGYDYAFGRGRGGGVSHLRDQGKRYGFGVTVIKPVSLSGEIVKSKMIRELASSSRFAEAVKLLGHPYIISGKVVRGEGRGRDLGFPTANLKVDKDKLVPSHGVYAGIAYVNGVPHKCVLNIGARPTFALDGTAVEVHIMHFTRRILGKTLKVEISHRLRDERQFSDVSLLIGQIKKDVARASRLVKIKLA